jgi:hypothetical protein
MASDILTETRRTFTALAHKERVSISTVWRWHFKGLKGHLR